MANNSEATRLGPFTGGINTLSDPTALQDTELLDVLNMELDLDGSYVARPPFFDLASPGSGNNMRLLGYFIHSGGSIKLIGNNSSGLWYFETGAWTFITGTTGLISTSMVQYDNIAYVIATEDSSIDGGSVSTSSATWTSIAAIPRGGSAVVHKERIYLVPGKTSSGSASTLLKFSEIAGPGTWPGANQIYINKGDGQRLVDIIVYNDNLLLFKEDSSYVLAFDLSPSDAVTRKLNNIGVSDRDCVVSYENQLYVLHENNVYEVVNYDFAKLNAKVPLAYDPTKPSPWSFPFFLTLLGDRLIVRYFFNIYVFGLKTKVWTRWETDQNNRYIGPAVATPIRDEANAIPTYIMPSAELSNNDIHSFRDVYDTAHSEDIFCSIKTKSYDFGVPHRYKRLFSWGADLSCTKGITGTLQPIVVNFSVTWDQVSAMIWSSVAANTWGQPLNLPIIVETVLGAQSAMRKYVKFLKSIRFRQIRFELDMSYDGTTSTGPCRFFTMTALVSVKQHVSKSLT